MKVLIQQNNSLRYYRGDGDWTTERNDGRNFGNTSAAVKVIHQETLANVSILLTFENSSRDLRLPVDEDTPRLRGHP